MKVTGILLSLICAASLPVHAQSVAHETLLARLKKSPDLGVKNAVWLTPTLLQVETAGGSSARGSVVAYVCDEAASSGIKGISVQVGDVSQLKNSAKAQPSSETRCS